MISPARHRLAASGVLDTTGTASVPDRQPLTVGEVALGTALGSALFYGVVLGTLWLVGSERPTPNPFARVRQGR